MIRFLQKETPLTKFIFIAIIGVTCITMVIFLVPGIFNDSTSSADTYATIRHGGIFGRFLPAEQTIPIVDVQQAVRRMARGQQIPDMLMPYYMQQAGQVVIQQHILLDEAHRLGITATDEDVRRYLHTGQLGQVLFPEGQYIGDARYAELISDQLQMTVEKFEGEIKQQIVIDRLRDLITGGVTVSPAEVREAELKQDTKIKFDYAVISADDLRKTINPTDTELQAFFKTRTLPVTPTPSRRPARFSTSPSRIQICRAASHKSATRRFSSTTTRIRPNIKSILRSRFATF